MRSPYWTLLTALACLLLVACSGGSDDNPGGGNGGPMDLSGPAGTFTADPGADSSTWGKVAGCVDTQDFPVVDPRLKVGTTFLSSMSWSSDHGIVTIGPATTRIESIDTAAKKVVKIQTGDNPLNGKPISFRMQCTASHTAEGYHSECSTLDPIDSGLESIQQIGCEIKTESKAPDEKGEFGTYTFADGKSIQAYRLTQTSFGTLECTTGEGTAVESGLGQVEEVWISSSEVPEEDFLMGCNNVTTLYVLKIAKNADGKILSYIRDEMKSFNP